MSHTFSLVLQGLIIGMVLIAIRSPGTASLKGNLGILIVVALLPYSMYFGYDTLTQSKSTLAQYNKQLATLPNFKGQAVCTDEYLVLKGNYTIKRFITESKSLTFNPFVEVQISQVRRCKEGWFPSMSRATKALDQDVEVLYQVAVERARIRQDSEEVRGKLQDQSVQTMADAILPALVSGEN